MTAMQHGRSAWRGPHAARRVVARLRLLFVAVAVALLASMLLGTAQLRHLDARSAELTQSSFPIFVMARKIESDLGRLILSLQRRATIATPSGIDRLSDAVAAQLTQIRHDLSQLKTLPTQPEYAPEMVRAVDRIDESAMRLLSVEREIRGLGDMLRARLDRLAEERAAAITHLEELAFETVEGTAPARPVSDADYRDRLWTAAAITELILQIETVTGLARQMSETGDAARLSRMAGEAGMRFQAMATLMGQFPDDAARRHLAGHVVALRDAVSGPGGMKELVTRLFELRALRAEVEAVQAAPMLALSGYSERLVESAGMAVDRARARLGRESMRMIWALCAATMVGLLLILGGAAFIVERQINRRMGRLTDAVLDIAGGDTDRRIDVKGPDELGDMAGALRVFRENARELRRSNAELEKFAYVAAHDLRSPLRAIRDLACWTIEDDGDALPTGARRNLDLMQCRIERMNTLLSDLLEYARIGRERTDPEPVRLPEFIEGVAAMLPARDRFPVTYEGPAALCIVPAVPLRQILLNLLVNGIKHHDRDAGRLGVRCRLADGRLHVEVEDDGPGIEPRHHDRIFDLFKTLRPRDEIEGSGLGLAIIGKLVDHNRGTIAVRSDPERGRGATFAFDLPADPLDERTGTPAPGAADAGPPATPSQVAA